MNTASKAPHSPRGSLIVLAALTLLWAAWAGWFLLAPDHNPRGQCEGLGFGCTLTPRDVAVFAGVVVLAPSSGLVLAVTGLVRAVRVGSGSRRVGWDIGVWALCVLGLVVVAAGAVRGAF